MYFSMITPKPGRERDAAASRATGPYREHQWLWQFFEAPEGTPRDFLFRSSDVDGMPRYHVVSERRPSPAMDGWDVQSREYDPKVAEGACLRFELRANPVVTHKREGKSRRDDVVMHAKREMLDARGLARWKDWVDEDKPPLYELVTNVCGQWLRSRAQQAGFAVIDGSLRVDNYNRVAEKASKRANGKAIQLSTVDFSGELEVQDVERFRMALLQGIGHAKAFGCGLLLVRPA